MDTDDYLFGLEEYPEETSTTTETTNSYFAPPDEIDVALPDDDDMLLDDPTAGVTPSTQADTPANDPMYDPAAPVAHSSHQASPKPNNQKITNFFKSPFGSNNNKNHNNKNRARSARTPKYLDPTAGPAVLSPLAAVVVPLQNLIPQISTVVAGHPATVALVVITLGKIVAFVTRADDDERLKASTIRPVKASAVHKKRTPKRSKRVTDANDKNSSTTTSTTTTSSSDENPPPVRRLKKPVERPKLDNLERPNHSREAQGWLSSLVTHTPEKVEEEKLVVPPKVRPQERIEDLRRRVEQVELEKANMEREYEKTNWELQETQIELNGLRTSTSHLLKQIQENEEMMDSVVKTERRRAKEELQRMKEAMLKVVEEEREAMRAEFMKQAGELQMIMRQKYPVPPKVRKGAY